MLRFFSKIRKSLLDEGKAARYTKYAIGEIFLVVVGILIALQINNWNEKRKERAIEITILQEILRNLEMSKASIEQDIAINKSAVESNVIITKALTKGESYSDSFAKHFGIIQHNSQYTVFSGGFEQLKTRGFETISNDEIVAVIISIHDGLYEYLSRLNDKNDARSIQQFLPKYQDYFSQLVVEDNDFGVPSLIPQSYNELIKNPEFLRLLSFQKYHNESDIAFLNVLVRVMQDAIQKLRDELSRLNVAIEPTS